MAALAVLTVIPICTHSIPGYALELFSLPMSSSLFALYSLPGLSFMFACLLACIAEGTYAGLYSWVPMVHGPRVLIRRICAWATRTHPADMCLGHAYSSGGYVHGPRVLIRWIYAWATRTHPADMCMGHAYSSGGYGHGPRVLIRWIWAWATRTHPADMCE